MLEVKNLTAIRDERILFESLSFEIHAGELVQIEGRNGTGKTTLLRIIAGLGECECGEILWQRSKIQSDRESYHQDLLFLGHQTRHQARTHRTGKFTFLSGGSSTNGG